MMRSRPLRWIASLAAVVLLLPGCGDTDDAAADTALAATTTTAPAPTTTLAATTTTPPATTVPLLELGPFEVTTTVVSHETTRDISVWAPDADGSWPIVYLIPAAGTGQDLAELATRLASNGTVVFAPDYRFGDSPLAKEQDLECGYRFVRSIAPEYGGDLDQPFTFVGDSYGASMALVGGLSDAVYGPGGSYDVCFTGAPRADLIVPIAGCYYAYEGEEFPEPLVEVLVDSADVKDADADLVLVVGEDDPTCQQWQSEDATEALQAAGYDARVVVVPGGNHGNTVFWRVVDGEWMTAPNDPIGKEVVHIILDAIDTAQQ
jgi:acetyl esterase/lipase